MLKIGVWKKKKCCKFNKSRYQEFIKMYMFAIIYNHLCKRLIGKGSCALGKKKIAGAILSNPIVKIATVHTFVTCISWYFLVAIPLG